MKQSYGRIRLALCLLAAVLFSSSAVSAALPVIAQVEVYPPKLGNTPVEVELGVHVDEILHIDEGENTYRVKGYLTMSWNDPRLAYTPLPGVTAKTYLEHDAQLMLEKIWWPDLTFTNEVGQGEHENQELTVTPTGRVEYRERFVITLASKFQMRKFPFDTQYLNMEIESFAWSREDLVLKEKKEILGFSQEFTLPGWRLVGLEEKIAPRQEPRDRAAFSELQVVLTVQREPGFFVWKFLVPLSILMVLISGVLWIPPDQIKDRVGATLTGMLTSAAYGFTISRYLPANVYDTYLDAVILISLFYSSALMIVHVISYRLHLNKATAMAQRLDQISRIVFPLGFLIILFLVAQIYERL